MAKKEWVQEYVPDTDPPVLDECGCCGRNHPDFPGDCRQWATCDECGDAHKVGAFPIGNFQPGQLVGPCWPYEGRK